MTQLFPQTLAALESTDALEPSPISEQRLVSRAGATAALREEAGHERIEVRDSRSRLLFELDPATGRTVVWAPDGDLSFRAQGDVEFVAAGSVRCRAEKEVTLEAGEGRARSTLSLGSRVAALSSEALRLAADSADLAFTRANVTSSELRAKVTDAKIVMSRLETITDRLFEQARSVFRTVEDLSQLKTGRARTLVREGYDLRAGHASIEAEAEVKIDGKAIHLG